MDSFPKPSKLFKFLPKLFPPPSVLEALLGIHAASDHRIFISIVGQGGLI